MLTPYRHRLESLHRFVSRSAVLIYYLHILSVAESNWLARPHLIKIWTCTGAKQISQASVCFSHQHIFVTPSGTTNFISTCLKKKSMPRSFNLGLGGKRISFSMVEHISISSWKPITRSDKRILEHESSYSKTGGHVLTVKFGNRQRRHRLRVIIGCSISGSADGSYQVANSRIPAIFG